MNKTQEKEERAHDAGIARAKTAYQAAIARAKTAYQAAIAKAQGRAVKAQAVAKAAREEHMAAKAAVKAAKAQIAPGKRRWSAETGRYVRVVSPGPQGRWNVGELNQWGAITGTTWQEASDTLLRRKP